MEGRCERHQFDTSDGLCRHCGYEFCSECLVYSFGPSSPPYCISCVLAAAGVRTTAANAPKRARRETRRLLRERRRNGRGRKRDSAPLVDDAAPLVDDAARLVDDAARLVDDAAPLVDDASPFEDTGVTDPEIPEHEPPPQPVPVSHETSREDWTADAPPLEDTGGTPVVGGSWR